MMSFRIIEVLRILPKVCFRGQMSSQEATKTDPGGTTM